MAAGTTYAQISSITTASTMTSVSFNSIPQTYTDLVLIVSGTQTGVGVAGLYISKINNDIDTNYSRTLLQGNGTSGSSAAGTSEDSLNIGLIGSVQTNSIFNFINYSNSTTFKTVLSRGNDSSALVRAGVGLWQKTEPITSFSVSGVTFSVGTTFSLYGIAAA